MYLGRGYKRDRDFEMYAPLRNAFNPNWSQKAHPKNNPSVTHNGGHSTDSNHLPKGNQYILSGNYHCLQHIIDKGSPPILEYFGHCQVWQCMTNTGEEMCDIKLCVGRKVAFRTQAKDICCYELPMGLKRLVQKGWSVRPSK